MVVHKYPLDITRRQVVQMPIGAQILSVQVQGGRPTVWALVDPTRANAEQVIYVFGTGHEVTPDGGRLEFLDTIQYGGGVWHVFKGVNLEN